MGVSYVNKAEIHLLYMVIQSGGKCKGNLHLLILLTNCFSVSLISLRVLSPVLGGWLKRGAGVGSWDGIGNSGRRGLL